MIGVCGWLCALAGLASPAPASTPVLVALTPNGGYVDSGVVRHGTTTWFANATSLGSPPDTVRIYRWRDGSWALAGTVPTQLGQLAGGGGGLSSASLTGSRAPDFALTWIGTDARWLTVVGRLRGRWRTVPFDYVRGPASIVGVLDIRRHRVVTATFCGCANGYGSSAEARFDGAMFRPVWPRGPRPRCTVAALDRAGVDDARGLRDIVPALRDLRSAFTVEPGRLACADGWALARGVRHGRRLVAIFGQEGRAWRRDEVGTPRQVGLDADWLDLPRSLLDRLARRVGVTVGPPHDEPVESDAQRLAEERLDFRAQPKPLRTTATVAVPPGSYVFTSGPTSFGGGTWFAVAVIAPRPAPRAPAPLTFHVFRWEHESWSERATVRTRVEDRDQFGLERASTRGAGFAFSLGEGLGVGRDGRGAWRPIRTDPAVPRLGW